MTNAILENLFGSDARVKIIRLFLTNPDQFFTTEDISRRARVSMPVVRKETFSLLKINFIKERLEKIEEVIKLKKGKVKNKKKKIRGLRLNILFPLINPLRDLILNNSFDKERFVKDLNSLGKMKLIIISGVLNQGEGKGTDLLVVGDSLRKSLLENILKKIEAQIGKEIVYAIFSTEEFMYRFSMYDRFLRDILDYPHEKLVNKLGI